MKKAKWPRIVLAALAVWVALLPQAVSAHPGADRSSPPGHREGIIGGMTGFCVHGTVHQEHTFHYVSTMASNCNNFRSAYHTQKQEYFKQDLWNTYAEYCFTEGWYQSNYRQQMYMHYPWDIWHWCNYGAGRHVLIYVDSWQYSWHDVQGWIGGAWRPATRHCHCP